MAIQNKHRSEFSKDCREAYKEFLSVLYKKWRKMYGLEAVRERSMLWMVQHNSDRNRRTETQRQKRKNEVAKNIRKIESLEQAIKNKTYLDDLNKEDNSEF